MAAGRQASAVTSHTDLSPTILKLAGGLSRNDFDGQPIPISAEETAQETQKWEHVNVEFWGRAVPEGTMGRYSDDYNPDWGYAGAVRNNTYKGLRLIGDGYSLYYSVHCTGEREFYDSIVRSPSATSPVLSYPNLLKTLTRYTGRSRSACESI